MARKTLPFRVIRKSFVVGRADTVLSQHKTQDAAQRAFDRVLGRAVLVGPDGKILNHRIV